jgi:hypothetical protein
MTLERESLNDELFLTPLVYYSIHAFTGHVNSIRSVYSHGSAVQPSSPNRY